MTRTSLPARRIQYTSEITHEGFLYSVSVGCHANGRPGEIFIQAHKAASPLEAVARDAAILLSLAIQHGVPLQQMREAVTRDGRGQPATIVGAVLDAMLEVSE